VVTGTVGTITVTAQGQSSGSTRRARGGDFHLATTGDLYLATSGDFSMAIRMAPGWCWSVRAGLLFGASDESMRC